jgi:hypothetical protein
MNSMVARIYEEIDLAPDESAPWPEQMRALLGWMVDALRAHPSTAILLATRNVASEGGLRTTEAALDILRRRGVLAGGGDAGAPPHAERRHQPRRRGARDGFPGGTGKRLS